MQFLDGFGHLKCFLENLFISHIIITSEIVDTTREWMGFEKVWGSTNQMTVCRYTV